MSNYIKQNHIELSDGDTCIVTNLECPLIEEQLKDLEKDCCFTDSVSGNKVVCCKCHAYFGLNYNVRIQCPHYYGYTYDTKHGPKYDCALLEPRKSKLNDR